MMLFLVTLCLLVVATPVLAKLYLKGLPQAPACPACLALTRAASDGRRIGLLLQNAGVSAVRECTCCGWRGRMRWRLAHRRVRSE